MGRRSAGVVALTLAAALTAACTQGSEPVADGPTESATPPTPSATTRSTTPPDAEPEFTQPLVIAVNIHRPALELTRAQANGLVDGSVSRWRQLSQPGGPLRVYEGARAAAVVQRDESAVAVIPASKVTPTVQAATVGGVDPLVAPARYPLTTAADTDVPEVTTMTVVGDIMLGRGVAARSPTEPGRALGPLSTRLARADLTIGNLESTLSDDGRPRQGDDSFAADPRVVAKLRDAGFDLVSLANNHTGDYGEHALRLTLSRLDDSRLERVGAGFDADDAWAPVVLRRGGVSFGFLAFNAIGETPRATADSPGSAEIRMQPRTGPLNASDLARMSRAIGSLERRVDVVIVIPHWGDQYTHVPVPDQRTVGRALVDAGADLVVGGHPHWVQGVDMHRGQLIAYSLGNFIFDMDFSIPTMEGAMLDLVFWGDEIKSARFVPYVIGTDFAPRLAPGPRAQGILDDIWRASRGPFRD